MVDNRKRLACAIYTRKSSEEGLEQSFNSLDAQREACEAFIASQRHEGWRVLETRYDDGGFSGGSIDRPGLRQLLEDIRNRKVDVVVVYKVDRLTRALSDFAKIVEIFDGHGVPFVSVTQQFNTTTSMGRLTLNVLLSFAQFEREVTGERIRDKFAASRKKGMWMGGPVPLGYDLKDRKLVINPVEAKTVREIFRLYAAYRCVRRLKADLNGRGVLSKCYVSETGRTWGGRTMGRGQLYYILRNRLYIGEAVHKRRTYPGEHEPIIDQELWTQVQATLDNNRYERRVGLKHKEPSLLAGLLFDEHDNRFSPSHTQRHGRRYRYYVSQAVLQHRHDRVGCIQRLPAHELENLVEKHMYDLLREPTKLADQLRLTTLEERNSAQVAAKRLVEDWNQLSRHEKWQFLRALIVKIVVRRAKIEITLKAEVLYADLIGERSADGPASALCDEERLITIGGSLEIRYARKETQLTLDEDKTPSPSPTPNLTLVKLIARAFDWYERFQQGQSTQKIAECDDVDRSYVARVLPLAFLAPDLVVAILDGGQANSADVKQLRQELPSRWTAQRDLFSRI